MYYVPGDGVSEMVEEKPESFQPQAVLSHYKPSSDAGRLDFFIIYVKRE